MTMVAELEIFKLFVLVLARVGGLMVSAPVLGSPSLPAMAKIGLSAGLALLIVPTLPALGSPLPQEGLALAVVALGELSIGMMIGFVVSILFAAIQLAGQIMDLQTGFGMMNVFNPALETQFPIYGFFLFLLAVLYMTALGGHHLMIQALASTYKTIPVGEVALRPALFLEVSKWGAPMFVDGLMISAPVAAAMVMAYATLGLLGRVVPQIQLFVVGFPLTIAIGLFLTAFIIGVYLEFLDGMFHRSFRDVSTLIRGLS